MASTRDRIVGAAGAVALEALILAALLLGLRATMPVKPEQVLKLFDVAPPASPPPIRKPLPPPRHAAPRRSGAAAPPNLHAKPTEIVVPPLPVPPPIAPPPPVVAAPVAGAGMQASAGAADTSGPGTGAGGEGDGRGAGGLGDGDGGGGDGGDGSPPVRKSGRIRNSDFPISYSGKGGSVSVMYAVEADGRADDCRITRSSGDWQLDRTTCRLIEERFRYKPATDKHGMPVRSWIVQDHYWQIEQEQAQAQMHP